MSRTDLCKLRRRICRTFAFTSAIILSAVLAVAVAADDWPTYQHDSARSGVTAEQLSLPLRAHWTHRPSAPPSPGWADPQPGPVEGIVEPPKVKYDDAFYATSAEGLVFYGSSTENLVCALDAATGAVRWRYIVGGPVRLAPTYAAGRLYFGSDDGCLYCLKASDGTLVWQRRPGPDDERVLGHGRMISMWPLRTSVLVDNGLAYYTAGIFPSERLYVGAVRAEDGAPLWTNDTEGERSAGQNGFSPQGYLLANAGTLFVPSGRSLPAAFSRENGKFVYQRADGRWNYGVVGGCYALLSGDKLYGGTGQIIGYDQTSGAQGFAWFPGKRLVITPDTSYMLTDAGVTALDRQAYPEASRRVIAAKFKRKALTEQRPKPADYDAKMAEIDREAKEAQAASDACTRFRYDRTGLETMIVSGDLLLAAGKDSVVALDRKGGKELWAAPLQGTAKGLAVADGRLLVSTDDGCTYCFASGQPPAAPAAGAPAPAPADALTPVYAQAAEQILKLSGVRRGYCLLLDCTSARLACELARRSDLTIYAADSDPERVRQTREAVRAAGLYGTRITVDCADRHNLSYSSYFANLIVSEEALLSGRLPADMADVTRFLKPCGGVLCLGRPAGGPKALTARRLQSFLDDAGLNGTVSEPGGAAWAVCRRGALPGAGQWTHQYGDAGNRASSEDTIVKAPLGVLWYGEPGPNKVPSRHAGNAAPLSINGRVYLQGINRIMCFDAYNGVMYWERELKGAYRVGMVYEASNIACDETGIYVAAGPECQVLDAETGQTRRVYKMPPTDDPKAWWGWLAVTGDTVYGSSSSKAQFSTAVFALAKKSGRVAWRTTGEAIRNNTICLDDGRVFYADTKVTPTERQEALADKVAELRQTKGLSAAEAEKELTSADVRAVFCLDAARGKTLWRRPVDLTDCGAHVLMAIATKGVVVFCGAHSDGHYWPQFLGGEYGARRATVLNATDGKLLWTKAIGYRIRPLVVGDMLVAEPWAFDLRTGAQKMREHPLTGEPSPWQFERPGHHCGCISGAPGGLFFRSWFMGYYDFKQDAGTQHFAGQRPGCWINAIPANGLLVMPEASSGCICLVSIHCTTVFAPRETNRAWGIYSTNGAGLPVQRLALNLGAPGDRRAPDQTLWLSYPRPWSRMPVSLKADIAFLKGGEYFTSACENSTLTGTDVPWVYTSGARGLSACSIPLVGPADGTAEYTVRLGFVESDGAQPGQRLFDIKLQGQPVAQQFDPVKEAGGANRVVIREFKGIPVQDALKLELVPAVKDPSPVQMPVLNSIEIVRERVRQVGLAAPDLTLSDPSPTATVTAQMANRTGAAFSGKLQVVAPEGFTVTPREVPLTLAVNARNEQPLEFRVTRPGAARTEQVKLQLVAADGALAAERTLRLEYLGPRGRLVIPVAEDTYVSAGAGTTNYGTGASLLVDGGTSTMGDSSHNITYLRFPLKPVGRIVKVTLRIHTAASEAAESGDSGTINLADDAWNENKLVYTGRPKPGQQVGKLGAVRRNEWEERVLNVDLQGKTELSLVLEPTSCDGATYISREGKVPAELVLEYEAAP